MSREAIEKIKIIIKCPDAACGEQMRWERIASQYLPIMQSHDHPCFKVIAPFAHF